MDFAKTASNLSHRLTESELDEPVGKPGFPVFCEH